MLLSQVVHMQKEAEQQRSQLEEAQKQLEHTSNRWADPAWCMLCQHTISVMQLGAFSYQK